MKRLVVKLGGSLLHQPDWVLWLERWVQEMGDHQYLMIVGGGEVVEGLRMLAATHRLDERAMHWRCVRALDVTLEIAKELLPSASVVEGGTLEAWVGRPRERGLWLVSVGEYYRPEVEECGSPTRLPIGSVRPAENWDTTTDTLAVLLGQVVEADCVYLLKSCVVEARRSLEEAMECGWIDRELVRVLRPGQECRLVTLKE